MRSPAFAWVHQLAAAVLCASAVHAEPVQSEADCEEFGRSVVIQDSAGDLVGFITAGEESVYPPPPEAIAVAPDVMSTVPAPLVALGEKTGCKVPTQRPKDGPPTWVFELAEGRGVVGWCQTQPKPGGVVDTGILVAVNTDLHPWSSCPSLIPLPYLVAAPVFVIESRTTTLEGYWEIEPDGFQGEPIRADDSAASYLSIDIGQGGSGNVITCHRGRWVMSGYH